MKPTAEPAKIEPADTAAAPAQTDAPAKADASAGEAQLAEPPKNLEFTEVPVDENAPVPAPALSEPPSQQPAPKPAVKPHKSSSGGKPILALSIAFVLFVALAAVAYYAYTKSQ